jgi:bifunctional N-acetylglucosamine-1-phosphate-uridyltransferase/glucosamine-1-phosphate-acetyltransferase GlmU-like protein
MTIPLCVHLVADAPVETDLCGRPALDWLLDTVEQLEPLSITVSGPAAAAVRERLSARRPQVSGASAGNGITVALRCSTPLLRAATVRQAIAIASAGTGPVAIEVERIAAWWDEPADDRRRVAAVAAAGALDVLEAPEGDVATIAAGAVESLRTTVPAEHARATTALYERIAAGWIDRGVVIDDPATTRIDASVRLESGVRILPGTNLHGDTVIGAGTRIGPVVTIQDTQVGAGCQIQYAVCQDARIGDRSNIGPFCWLRSGTRLGADTRAGAFVELADSTVGDGTSIPHLGGLFSTDVGRNCNIAGMSAPANFNGVSKSRVTIGDDVSIGAGNILVAPISIGDGASTAAGSTITMDVPGGGLGFARAPQHNFPGWHGAAPTGASTTHGAGKSPGKAAADTTPGLVPSAHA